MRSSAEPHGRVAYWIGRYVERAEQTARITDVTFSHTLTMGSTPEAEARRHRHWMALLDIVGERTDFAPDEGAEDEDTVPTHLLFSPRTRTRSSSASPARARTRARCATSSPPRCGRP